MRLSFVIIALLLFSCTQNLTQEEIEKRIKSRDFSVFKELPSCSCDELKEAEDLLYKDDSLYTGNCYLNYPNLDQKYEIRQIFKGQLYGNRIILSPKGDTLTQSEYKKGDVFRENVGKETCDCEELEKFERADGIVIHKYFNDPFTGYCKRFYPAPYEDKVYLEAQYKNGKLHGSTIMYDKSGNIILEEKYVKGEKI